MNLVNETPWSVGCTISFGKDGREVAVVVARATYALVPAKGEITSTIADEQWPLVESDTFSGDPATTAPVLENDFAHEKLACDVLLVGSAHSAARKATRALVVGLRVGELSKSFAVLGNRQWEHRRMAGPCPTEPEPFVEQPISYDVAFGGVDPDADDPATAPRFLLNPVGRGYAPFGRNVHGRPLPVTEAIGASITSPTANYTPMALGPLGRNWAQRYRYAGTYDQTWQRTRMPLLPDDFDPRYFQAAPLDQQHPFLKGGEPIVLSNLHRRGRIETRVPSAGLPVLFVPHRGDAVEVQANLDTLSLFPDDDRFTLTWRARYATTRDVFELREVVVGGRSRSWRATWRAATMGKRYYPSLAALVRDRRGRR